MTTPRRVLRHWLLILAVPLIALIWVAYRVHQLRRDVLASVAQCPLNQLMLGLHNYHDVYGSFPPACVKDDRGRPLHSWRVLILPYINEQALYEQYDFSVPWNSPHNSRLNDRMPDMFHSCTEVPSKSFANYVVITGPGTVFPFDGCTKLGDISDGAENTILLAEVGSSRVPWLAPIDLPAEEAIRAWTDPSRTGISCVSWRRPMVVFGDRITAFSLDRTLAPESLRSLTSIFGGEPVTKDQLCEMGLIRRGAWKE
jgi:hypothetical protein